MNRESNMFFTKILNPLGTLHYRVPQAPNDQFCPVQQVWSGGKAQCYQSINFIICTECECQFTTEKSLFRSSP